MIIIILYTSFVLGVEVKINSPQTIIPGERISFEYEIYSKEGGIIQFIPYIECETLPIPTLSSEEIDLEPGELYKGLFEDQDIENNIPSQECRANIEIVDPLEDSYSVLFYIQTDPIIKYKIEACGDELCDKRKSIFEVNQKIYLQYDTGTEDIEIESQMIYPDGNVELLSLPTSIELNEVGSYFIESSATKEDYKSVIPNAIEGIGKA